MAEAVMQIEQEELEAARKNRFPRTRFSSSLESEFQAYRHERLLKRVPTIGAAALVLFVFFAILDFLTMPESAYQISIVVRIFFICPMIILAMYAAGSNWAQRWYASFYCLAYVSAGLGIIAIIYTARIHAYSLPYDGLLLHLVFGYFLMGMPFLQTSVASLLVSFAYFAMEISLGTANDVLVSNAMFILSLNFMGIFGSFMQERSRRLLFLNTRLLELSKQKDAKEIASKTRLIATASHDLRQPLHAINLLLETLEKELHEDKARRLTSRLKTSTRQLSQLLSSLLNISKLNAGIVEVHHQALEFPVLIASLVQDYQLREQQRDLTLHTAGPESSWVMTDPVLLERVIRNLFENVYAHAQASCIHLSWSRQAAQLVFELRDDGCGIPAKDQSRIFEEFQRAGENQGQGMGLGLAIVRQLCELLDLQIELESGEGKGTAFRLYLPLTEAPRGSLVNKDFPASHHADARVLVIDDEQAVLDSTAMLLSAWGYQVTTCLDPEQALIKVSDGVPDIILCDYRFENSDRDGVGLIQAIRRQSERCLPAILISGDTHGDLEEAITGKLSDEEHSATGIAFKPLLPARLRLMLRYYLRTESEE